MSNLFEVHKLNDEGLRKAKDIADHFEKLVVDLLEIYFSGASDEADLRDPRSWAIVKTKLQEACFFAKRVMAMEPENQLKP
jgi:hypothetical protein